MLNFRPVVGLAALLSVCIWLVHTRAGATVAVAREATTGVVAFAAADNDTPCHRDASSGCDVYIGDIDLTTGTISHATLVNDGFNGSAAAQWFPALSPDGRWLAYSETPGNRIVLVKLAGMTTLTIANAKFPAFSADSRRLYYSAPDTDAILSVVIGAAPLPAAVTVTSTPGTDPFPIGDLSGDSHVVYHVEEPPNGVAVPYLHTVAAGVNAADTRMPCIPQGAFIAVPCGHVSVSASMNKIGATGPGSTTFWISQRSGSTWSAFAPSLNNAQAAIEAKDARFIVGSGRATFLGNAAWPSDNLVVSTAEAATGSSGHYTTTLSRLFVVNLVTEQFTAVTVTGYSSAHFQTGQASIVPNASVASLMPTFTDAVLAAGSTSIRAVHVSELRSVIDTLRARNSLAPFQWTDAPLTDAVSSIKATHVTELRAALTAAYQAAGATPPAYTDPTLTAGSSRVKAAHISELRAAALWLW